MMTPGIVTTFNTCINDGCLHSARYACVECGLPLCPECYDVGMGYCQSCLEIPYNSEDKPYV